MKVIEVKEQTIEINKKLALILGIFLLSLMLFYFNYRLIEDMIWFANLYGYNIDFLKISLILFGSNGIFFSLGYGLKKFL